MRELRPLAALQVPQPEPNSGRGGAARGLPPPTPPPVAAAGSVAAGAPAPAVQVALAGLEAEAWLWSQAAGSDAPEAGTALRGPARLVPLLGSAPQGPAGSPGEWVATVLGPAAGDGLLARAGDALLWLPGPRPGLPPGARLLVSWRSTPSAATGRPPDLAAAAVPPGPGPAAAPEAWPGAPIRAGPGTLPPAPSDGSPEPPESRRAGESAPAPPGIGAGSPTGPAEAVPVAVAALGLARLLGLAARPAGEEGGNGAAGSAEEGRSRLEIDFPELGRVRLELAWSARGIELRLTGPSDLSGGEQAELVRAFGDGLELGGARGRILVLDGRPVAPSHGQPPAGAVR